MDRDFDEDDENYDSDFDYYWIDIFLSPLPFLLFSSLFFWTACSQVTNFFISYFIRDNERMHEKWMNKIEK